MSAAAVELLGYKMDLVAAAARFSVEACERLRHAAETHRIKVDLKDGYFPDSAAWREMVLFRARQVLRQASVGLASI